LPAESDPVHYLDFSDYTRIIGDKENWNATFHKIFGTREIIVGELRELEPIRNAIPHSGRISATDRQKLQLYCLEIRRNLR
jgi:hypothetical protein